MVKLSNGVNIITVPEGAVRVYRNMGFRPIAGTQKKVEQKQVKVEEEKDAFSALLEKPLSQWNQKEVKEFAAAKGYDVSGAKSLKQAKAIIREALEREEKAAQEV